MASSCVFVFTACPENCLECTYTGTEVECKDMKCADGYAQNPVNNTCVGRQLHHIDGWLALLYHYVQLVGVGIIVCMSHIIN